MSSRYEITTAQRRQDWFTAGDELINRAWPAFVLHDPVAGRYWDRLYQDFPEYQFVMLDDERVVAVGNSLPLHWEGDWHDLPDGGWDWEIAKGFLDLAVGQPPNVLGALGITIDPEYQGMGLSGQAVTAMKAIGKKNDLGTLIAPVRPSLKSRFPLIPMEQYITWRNPDGLPYDPWMRVHERHGAMTIKVCPASMKITGSIDKWQAWTGMSFPGSGAYIVPGALNPIDIDCSAGRGSYVEPNVWMVHLS